MKTSIYVLLFIAFLNNQIQAMETEKQKTDNVQEDKNPPSILDIDLIMDLSGANYFLDKDQQKLARAALLVREQEEKQKQKKKNNIEALS